MKVFVGLGNPGIKYKNTRHNFGFSLLDALAEKVGVQFKKSKFEADLAEFDYRGDKIILVKPTTYMNKSGEAIRKVLDYYKIPVSDLIIFYDDIDIGLGTYRKTGKSSAGHKGAQSIFDQFSTEDIARYRLGIKSSELKNQSTDAYVLQKFTPAEKSLSSKVISDILEELI